MASTTGMGFWNDLSIPRKLSLMNLATTTVALFAASAGYSYLDYTSYREELKRTVRTAAEIISANSTAALSFNDPQAAQEILQTLSAEPHVVLGCIYDRVGAVFAVYKGKQRQGEACPLSPRHAAPRFAEGFLVHTRTVEIDGSPVGTLYLRAHLEALHQRLIFNAVTLALILLFAVALTAALLKPLRASISDPLRKLAATATRVSETQDYTLRAEHQHSDEIGVVVDRFNEMLERIGQRELELRYAKDGLQQKLEELKKAQRAGDELQKQVVQASRRAGMAEVAASVLHNVGNVLTSINVSSDLAVASVRRWPVEDVQKVAALLEQHAADSTNYLAVDKRGQRIPGFLQQLGTHFQEQRKNVLGELESLSKNIEHIKGIIGMQQNLARAGGLEEPVKLHEVMDQAVAINAAALERHRIEVIRRYEQVAPVILDRHQVLQILVNLLSNAKHAINSWHNPNRTVTVEAGMVEGRTDRVFLRVSDTGVGIAAERLQRLFTQGYTTRPGGHGLGLHSGASSARLMGGSLTAESGGEGCGATFTLELPARFAEASVWPQVQ